MEGSVRFVFQVAVILLVAKAMGEIFSRWLKQPRVLGQLVAGILIGPFALGSLEILGFGPLFESMPGLEIHGLTIVGSIVLLFVAGLETDLDVFIRYSGVGVTTALGGAVISFFTGAGLVVLFMGKSFTDPAALIMGTMALATSVGVTVAVLSELRKMDSPEGATILSAAVIDDVLGLIVLATVISLVGAKGEAQKSIDVMHILGVVAKAGLFWFATMALGILGRPFIRRFLKAFGGSGSISIVALALALLLAALAEKFGLALIIGAYTTGLALSRLDMAHEIQHRMRPLHEFLVPIFFCVSGMMVDVTSIGSTIVFGSIFAVGCIAAKVIGSAIGAWPMGFNLRGVLRIGFGMSPRQEVALIVASTALAKGAIDRDLYSAGVLMCLVATVVAPPALKSAFGKGSGLWKEKKGREKPIRDFRIELPGPDAADLVATRMVGAFQQEEFYVLVREQARLYEFRKEGISIFMHQQGSALEFRAAPGDLEYARFIVLEEILAIGDLFRDASRLVEMNDLKRSLLATSS